MRKALLLFNTAAICALAAFRYFQPDFSWFANASSDGNGSIANMDQALPHAVLPSVDNVTVVAVAVDDQGEESVESFVKKRFSVSGTSVPINYPLLGKMKSRVN